MVSILTQPPRRGGPRNYHIVAVVLGVLTLIGLLAGSVLWLSSPTVPDVVGQTVSEAKRSVGEDYKIDVSSERVDSLP